MWEDFLNFDYLILIRLVVATLCGGIIGLERSENNHAAGLRTHILLCVGAASIMVVSELVVVKFQIEQEVLRMGAQIISGVGFLGAGSIIFDGRNNKIQGITTAAGLWTTACLGIVVGLGYYVMGITMLVIMMIAMLGLRPVAERLAKKSKHYRVTVKYSDMSLSRLLNIFNDNEMVVHSIRVDTTSEEKEAVLDVKLPNRKIGESDIMAMFDGIKAKIEVTKI